MKRVVLFLTLFAAVFGLGHWHGRLSSRGGGGDPLEKGPAAPALNGFSTVPALTNLTTILEERYGNGDLQSVTVSDPTGAWEGSVSYYPGGAMKGLETRYGGLRTGICAYFSEDGTPRTQGVYSGGQLRVGTFRQFYGEYTPAPEEAKGRPYITHEGYGCSEGLRTVMRANGMTNSMIPYRHGKPHGPSREYEKAGTLDCIREYANGEEVRRTGYDRDGRKVYLKVSGDGSGHGSYTLFNPDGTVRRRDSRCNETGEEEGLTYGKDGALLSRAENVFGFPRVKREYYASGEVKAVRDFEQGTEQRFHTNGVLAGVAQYEYNALISRKTLGEQGEVLELRSFGEAEPAPERWGDTVVDALPGERDGVPELFYAYKTYPAIRCNNDKALAWPQTMRDWRASVRFSGGTYKTRYPRARSVTGGMVLHHFSPVSPRLDAIGVAFHALGRGPGWLCLSIKTDADGTPSDTVLARSWLRYPEYCQVPSRGLLVFRLPPIEWQVGARYWFECGVDFENSAKGAHHLNYWILGEDKVPAFKLIESCDPVPMQRRAVLSNATAAR